MAAPSSPLPFEDPECPGFWNRLGLTLRCVCTAPMAAYGALPRGRSLGAPWRLKLLLAAPCYLLLGLGLGLLQLTLVAIACCQPSPLPRVAFWAFPALILALLIAGPLLQLATMLVGGLLLHGLLWIFRGTRTGLGARQTIRATGYTQAVQGLLLLAPILGLFAYPCGKVALGLGLARLHRTEPWRGLAAALSQALLALVLAAALVLGLVLWAVRQEQRARQILMPTPELAPLEQPEQPQGPLHWL